MNERQFSTEGNEDNEEEPGSQGGVGKESCLPAETLAQAGESCLPTEGSAQAGQKSLPADFRERIEQPRREDHGESERVREWVSGKGGRRLMRSPHVLVPIFLSVSGGCGAGLLGRSIAADE
jgi:hypothetical protein